MEVIDIAKYLGILYLIVILVFMILIIINGGMTSNETPPKDTAKVQEMYCGCGGKRPPQATYL